MQFRNVHYAWIILGLYFFGLLAVQGVRLAFGAFVEPCEQQFQILLARWMGVVEYGVYDRASAVGLISFADPVLQLFGTEFTAAKGALIVLILG